MTCGTASDTDAFDRHPIVFQPWKSHDLRYRGRSMTTSSSLPSLAFQPWKSHDLRYRKEEKDERPNVLRLSAMEKP